MASWRFSERKVNFAKTIGNPLRVGLHGSCPFPGDDAACLFGTGVVCDSFLAGETWESSRNYLRVGATLRVLGGIFMTSSGQTRWLTRFIAHGIAPQAGLGKWRIFLRKYLKAVRFFWWIFIDFAQKTDKIHLVDICFQLLVTFSQDCFSGGCCSLSYTFQWISGAQ